MPLMYILYSAKLDSYYIGYTSGSLIERIRRYNSKHKGFTGQANDWKIRYYEHFANSEEAKKRESEIKSWKSRKRIEKLVQSIP